MARPKTGEEGLTKGRRCHVCGSPKKLHRYVGSKFFCADHTAEAFAEAVSVRRGSYVKGQPNIALVDGPDHLTRVRREDGLIPAHVHPSAIFEDRTPPGEAWEEPSV